MVVVAAAAVAVPGAPVIAAAVAHQEHQDDDPPPVVAAEQVADTAVIITTHKNTSEIGFSLSFAAHSMVFLRQKNVHPKKKRVPVFYMPLQYGCMAGIRGGF